MRDEVLNTANSRQTKGFRNAIPCLCRRAERRNETEEKVFDLKLWLVNKKKNQNEPPHHLLASYAETHAAAPKSGLNGLQCSRLIIGKPFPIAGWTWFSELDTFQVPRENIIALWGHSRAEIYQLAWANYGLEAIWPLRLFNLVSWIWRNYVKSK